MKYYFFTAGKLQIFLEKIFLLRNNFLVKLLRMTKTLIIIFDFIKIYTYL